MEPVPATPADAAAVAAVVATLESSFYGHSTFSQADVEDEWSDLDLERRARVVRDGDHVVGYGELRQVGELWRGSAYVHPGAQGRGIGRLLATHIEQTAARDGARSIQNEIIEADAAARRLLTDLGYLPVRVFREMRIDLLSAPAAPAWPAGLRVAPFDAERDARAFHAAHQEAFADHWGFAAREFAAWSDGHIGSERFDPGLWCVVRSGAEIVAGTISTADTYGGGYVHSLFTRRPWRGRGVGAGLLAEAFARFWSRGERSVGLGVDAANETGAFRLYERAGMAPTLSWGVFEKQLGDAPATPR